MRRTGGGHRAIPTGSDRCERGRCRFTQGDPITMDGPDVAAVKRHAPDAHVIAVHMDAINHCMVTRLDLASYLASEQLDGQVLIPRDGESFVFDSKSKLE